VTRLILNFEGRNRINKFELFEALDVIDEEIKDALAYEFYRYFDFPRPLRGAPFTKDWMEGVTFVHVQGVDRGSVIVTILLAGAGAAVGWSLAAVAKGADNSRLGKELRRTGEILGDLIGPVVGRINDRLEQISKVRSVGASDEDEERPGPISVSLQPEDDDDLKRFE
jgi:hypothetical protein